MCVCISKCICVSIYCSLWLSDEGETTISSIKYLLDLHHLSRLEGSIAQD